MMDNFGLGTISLTDALVRGRRHAPYLDGLARLQPPLADLLSADDWAGAQQWTACAGDDAEDIIQSLRWRKRALALTLATGDLAGQLPLSDVVEPLSEFADSALDTALKDIYRQRFDQDIVAGFAVIALGKHGSRELNYSSDIDPIFIYDPDILPVRRSEEPHESARRIGQQLIKMLQERTGDGYVFRVDMRLRPTPEASPVALPVDAAIGYYESSALTWEQAAFIRARAAAGDPTLGQGFLDQIQPFIWRRALDYGAIKNINRVTQQIRDHYQEGQAFGPGYDLKRGRGGIREAEFYAQMHQMIFGGRDPQLRTGATVAAYDALVQAGRIDGDIAAQLSGAYQLYRTVEHRLQMVNDQQTHSLPVQTAQLDTIAQLCGLADRAPLLDMLAPHVDAVGTLYDALVERPSDDDDTAGTSSSSALPAAALPTSAARISSVLAKLPDDDLALFEKRVEHWRSGKIKALRSDAAITALEAVLPHILTMLVDAPDRLRALNRLDHIIENLPTAINFFHLLEARPALAETLARILSHAPVLADALAQRINLLDGLIDNSALDLPPDVGHLTRELGRTDGGDDYQSLLDMVRVRVGEKRFALAVQIIEARHDNMDIAAGYSRVAEAAIHVLARGTIAEFAAAHGHIPDSELVILALGRLGGEALTHASDLDLVFLFTGDHGAQSDGPRPLGATQYYNRLAQRIVGALSVSTASGPLYEVDTRLRPSGAQGLLAVSIDSFAKYQREQAWTWEHMALTRARVVFGSKAAQSTLNGLMKDVLSKTRDAEELRKAVRKMRLDIVAHKPPSGPLDTKLMEGGLVDWEFIVHFLQLRSGEALHPQLDKAIAELVALGHADPALEEAYRLMARLLVGLRLISPNCDYPPPSSRELIAKSAGGKNWQTLLAGYDSARQSVIDEWNRLLRPDPDEILGPVKAPGART